MTEQGEWVRACIHKSCPDHVCILAGRGKGWAKGRPRVLRGTKSNRTHCKHGHPYTSESITTTGKRRCLACQREQNGRWRNNNPEAKKRIQLRASLKKRYGLTEEKVAAMRARQNGNCAVCGECKTLVIDHSHSTGRVRGLVCHGCNSGLGHVENGNWLALASAYLANAALEMRPDE